MNNINFQYAYWFITNKAKKIGTWGLLGICLVIASLLFYVMKIPKIEAQIKETQADKVTLSTNSKHHTPEITNDTPQNKAEDISRFYATFPTAVDLPQALATMYKVANKQKLMLNSGDYKFNKIKETNTLREKKLTKYEIVLPIKGQYLQIRTFISEVLQQLPALALMDMQIRRENSVNPNVEARLVFAIFVRGES